MIFYFAGHGISVKTELKYYKKARPAAFNRLISLFYPSHSNHILKASRILKKIQPTRKEIM